MGAQHKKRFIHKISEASDAWRLKRHESLQATLANLAAERAAEALALTRPGESRPGAAPPP